MKLGFRKVVTSLLLSGVVVLSGGFAVSSAHADVNDFTFSSLHATYLLGVDETGHSTLTTREKLVAVFPQEDQNRGIQRAIPLKYDGHGTNLTLESVVNGTGVPLAYTAEETGGFLVVTIASQSYVHGEQTYVLTYTQKDVTLTPANGNGTQEFYWDVNGTGWSQPFDSVEAVVLMPGELGDRLTGNAACYQGTQNVADSCSSLERAALGQTAQFTATANALAPGENLTVAIEFAPGTFVERNTSFFATPLGLPLILLVILGVGIFGTTVIIRRTRWRDHPGRVIIIAEYGPPLGLSPLVAVNIFGKSSKAIPAAIVSLAVSGNIRILDESTSKNSDSTEKRLRGRKAGQDFTLELVSASPATPEESELLGALFGAESEPGSQRGLAVVDAGLNRMISRIRSGITRSLPARGIRGTVGKGLPAVLMGVSFLVTITAVAIALAMANQDFGGPAPFLLVMLTVIAAFLTVVLSANVHPLTEHGAALRDHLRGLREFIVIAEADRLRVLQSPTGALRVPVDVTDARLRIALTEKVLPYAVLFGLEKEWSEELANLYAANDVRPEWYSGSAGFNAVLFSSSLLAFSSAASGAWAPSASSSGMGGSGGGGFSGGGGGGGGGGGV